MVHGGCRVMREIQIAVARADIIICQALRWLAVLIPLSAWLILAVIAARSWAGYDSCWIDYDAPGVDITSEGPEDDCDDAWQDWR